MPVNPTQYRIKKNTRKAPCEVCGVKTSANHHVSCQWAYIPRDSNKARVKRMSDKERLGLIQIILNL